MSRVTVPSGPVWEAAKLEKNWLAFAIVPQPGRKPLKQPANVKWGSAPNSADRVAIFDFPTAAEGINQLNRRLLELNQQRAKRFAEIEAENSRLEAKGERPKANYFGGQIKKFTLGYLPRDGSAMIGLDFDNILEDGKVAKWAEIALAAFETFSETSSSGRGVRMLAARTEADAGLHGERNDAGIIATGGKGFVITFDHWNGAPTDINPAPVAVASLLKQMGSVSPPRRGATVERVPGLEDAVNPVEWLPAVFAALPNTLDYDSWVKLGHAFKRAEQLGLLEAFDVFDEFSGRFSKGEIMPGEEAAHKWGGFDPRSVSIGTIWYIARDLGWDGKNPRPGVLPERPFRPDVDLSKAVKAVASGDAGALRGLISGVFFQINLNGWWAKVIVSALCEAGGVEMDLGLFRQTEDRWLAYADDLMSGAADLRRFEKTRVNAKQRDVQLAARQMSDTIIADHFVTIAERLRDTQLDGAIAFLELLKKTRSAL